MPAANELPDVVETTEPERRATGFVFTEGPLWHPEGFWYFVDIRQNKLFRIRPGSKAELVRETKGANGTTFDLKGNLVACEGDARRVVRFLDGGKLAVMKTPNADLPMVHGKQALLTLDVWEHAYYIDHRNARPKFIETFLDKLINWDFVNANLEGQAQLKAA